MADHNELGAIGESIAVAYLEDKGFKIKEINWKSRRLEVDIIAEMQNVLIFVEVKTRSNNHFGEPEEAVTAKKEQLLVEAASAYCHATNYEAEIRFDIISITMEPKLDIRHFEDAFFPGWDEE